MPIHCNLYTFNLLYFFSHLILSVFKIDDDNSSSAEDDHLDQDTSTKARRSEAPNSNSRLTINDGASTSRDHPSLNGTVNDGASTSRDHPSLNGTVKDGASTSRDHPSLNGTVNDGACTSR